VLRRKPAHRAQPSRRRTGSVFVEYILLVTIVGIGIIVGLACLREALVNELLDLAAAINAIDC
jgi:pilus assembly protein Flp/PilA